LWEIPYTQLNGKPREKRKYYKKTTKKSNKNSQSEINNNKNYIKKRTSKYRKPLIKTRQDTKQ
jgi:hypothetical protein